MNQALPSPTQGQDDSPAVPHGKAAFQLSGRAVMSAWIFSILVHTVLFGILLVVVFPFGDHNAKDNQPTVFTQIIGSVDAVNYTPSPAQDIKPLQATQPTTRFRPQPQDFSELSELTTFKKPTLSVIGIGASGGGHNATRFAIDLGVTANFFGLGGSVRGGKKIVYVVDRSGSMEESFKYVKEELKRSISALRRSQKFHVIFFNDNIPLENPPKKLLSAIGTNKAKFFLFLETVLPNGRTDPTEAMKLALSLKPDILYFISDGELFSIDRIKSEFLSKLNLWNKDHYTRIFTLAYLDSEGKKILETIARQHNGEYKYISEYDLP